MAHALADLFYDMAADRFAAESSEEDVVVAPQNNKTKVSSAAAHGASSDAAHGASSDAAHGASSDAAAGQTIARRQLRRASVSAPVARALLDPRGGRIIQGWVAPLREVVRPILRDCMSEPGRWMCARHYISLHVL